MSYFAILIGLQMSLSLRHHVLGVPLFAYLANLNIVYYNNIICICHLYYTLINVLMIQIGIHVFCASIGHWYGWVSYLSQDV